MHVYYQLLIILSYYCLFTSAASIKSELYKASNGVRITWDDAIALATAFVKQMTLEEKCNMTAGVVGTCVGVISGVPRLNFSGFCLQDSASGVGSHAPFSTAFADGIQIAATWDRDLFYQRAAAIGHEFKEKGIHYALGPTINLARNALYGRNWEAFGADPYLAGENSYYYVQGLQDQGVVANAKHYICHEQETFIPNSVLENINTHGYLPIALQLLPVLSCVHTIKSMAR